MGSESSKPAPSPPKPAPAAPKPAPVAPKPNPLLDQNWRSIDFDASKKKTMLKEITDFQITKTNPKVSQLHILVHGPVGVGKSSFISSIASACRGRMVQPAKADAGSGTSFTKKFKTIKMRGRDGEILPFVISDIMGLEDQEAHGARTEDLVLALEGHLKDGYCFNPAGTLNKESQDYNSCPTLNDKVHCLVSVLPGDKIGMMQHEDMQCVIQKLREVRVKATELDIPQVILVTMVDKTCPVVSNDLSMIYRSKKIKEKMTECETKLGVPVNFIYPVKNYHNEGELHDDVDILLLAALKNILHFANDHLEEKLDH